MALSMEEQRILAEIEEQLAREDPRLAGRLSGDRPGRSRWSRRRVLLVSSAAALGSLTAVVSAVVAVIS